MYVQESTTISESDTSESVHDRLAVLGAGMIRRYLDDILQGKIAAEIQDDELATYAPMIKKEAGRIDWRESAPAIDRRIRAMTPWPGAFSEWEGQNLKILAAHPILRTSALTPGTAALVNGEIAVQTGDGLLVLDQLQLAGKKASSAEAFVRGRPQFVGSVLAS